MGLFVYYGCDGLVTEYKMVFECDMAHKDILQVMKAFPEAFHYDIVECPEPMQDYLEHNISPFHVFDMTTKIKSRLDGLKLLEDWDEAIKVDEAFDLFRDIGMPIVPVERPWDNTLADHIADSASLPKQEPLNIPVNKPADKAGTPECLVQYVRRATDEPICCCDYITCEKRAGCPGAIDNEACTILKNWHVSKCKHNPNINRKYPN